MAGKCSNHVFQKRLNQARGFVRKSFPRKKFLHLKHWQLGEIDGSSAFPDWSHITFTLLGPRDANTPWPDRRVWKIFCNANILIYNCKLLSRLLPSAELMPSIDFRMQLWAELCPFCVVWSWFPCILFGQNSPFKTPLYGNFPRFLSPSQIFHSHCGAKYRSDSKRNICIDWFSKEPTHELKVRCMLKAIAKSGP